MAKEIKEWDLDHDWETDDLNYSGVEDYQILSSKVLDFNLLNQKKTELERIYSTQDLKSESMSLPNLQQYGTSLDSVDEPKYKQFLKESFDTTYPLFFLSREQRKFLLEKITIRKITQKMKLYSEYEDANFCAFILLEGEIHVFKNDYTFIDYLNSVTLFGYDGPIFQKRMTTTIAEHGTVIAVIKRKDFLNVIHPFSQFASFLSRNIRNKDKILDSLNSFKNFVLSHIERGPIDFNKLIDLYKKINPCIHQKCNSEEIDFSAWTYSLSRLPVDVIETYIFVLVNRQPRILNLNDKLSNIGVEKVKCIARNRDIYKYLDGKNVIVLRDMESDVLDFISNICIYYIESKKLRSRIYSPITLNELEKTKGNFEETVKVLTTKTGVSIYDDDKAILKGVFGNSFADKLINLCLNYQDISVRINKSRVLDKDSVEFWTQNLWNSVKSIFDDNTEMDEIDDLYVDIFQGSKRTLLFCICPHMYANKEEILKWGDDNKIETITKSFLTETDKLIAYSYYYYLAHPEKEKEKEKMNKEHGIIYIEKTYGTGVGLVLINVNKLNPKYVDPELKIKPKTKHHIILHIGYTFGYQSHEIIKQILMLFGNKAKSLNLIGKCGGLIGNRSDIIIADRIISDKSYELVSINTGKINIEEIKKVTQRNVHIGTLLTVAGTILQNYDLLNFYKHVVGCVGLEMEGYYYAKVVEDEIKHKMINNDFIMRCFYYVSDLPLDPTQTLSKEGVAVNWNEGVGAMNAIQRIILKQIFSQDE